MRKVESLSLKYVGYSSPENEDELELELAGLETVIASAKQRIAILKQGLRLTNLMKNSMAKEKSDAKIVPETSSQDK